MSKPDTTVLSSLEAVRKITGSCRARAAAHTLASEETVFQFLVYILAMVRSDVDKARTKLAQRIDGTEECCCSVTFQRR